ncbi:Iron-sulfur cluster repair protein YtfE [Klebsiella pneumoniae]|nr:Iron-sulfur cluster repair protein YtfE [Klebsiella pneumoniae]
MYNGINEMIDDLMEHISTENNVLFPRALGESKGRPRAPSTCPSYLATPGGLFMTGRCKQR